MDFAIYCERVQKAGDHFYEPYDGQTYVEYDQRRHFYDISPRQYKEFKEWAHSVWHNYATICFPGGDPFEIRE